MGIFYIYIIYNSILGIGFVRFRLFCTWHNFVRILQSGRPIQRHCWTFTSCSYKDACNDYTCNGSSLPVRVVDIHCGLKKAYLRQFDFDNFGFGITGLGSMKLWCISLLDFSRTGFSLSTTKIMNVVWLLLLMQIVVSLGNFLVLDVECVELFSSSRFYLTFLKS